MAASDSGIFKLLNYGRKKLSRPHPAMPALRSLRSTPLPDCSFSALDASGGASPFLLLQKVSMCMCHAWTHACRRIREEKVSLGGGSRAGHSRCMTQTVQLQTTSSSVADVVRLCNMREGCGLWLHIYKNQELSDPYGLAVSWMQGLGTIVYGKFEIKRPYTLAGEARSALAGRMFFRSVDGGCPASEAAGLQVICREEPHQHRVGRKRHTRAICFISTFTFPTFTCIATFRIVRSCSSIPSHL